MKLYQTILENSSRIESVFNPPLRSRSMQGSWKNACSPYIRPLFPSLPSSEGACAGETKGPGEGWWCGETRGQGRPTVQVRPGWGGRCRGRGRAGRVSSTGEEVRLEVRRHGEVFAAWASNGGSLVWQWGAKGCLRRRAGGGSPA